MASITPLAFSPTSISNCALWLDPSDKNSLTLVGNNITLWNDKSGNGRNASATGNITNTGTIHGLPTATFGGSQNTFFLGSNSNTGSVITAFGIYSMNSGAGAYSRLLSFNNYSTGGQDSASTAAQVFNRWNSTATIVSAQAALQLGTVNISYATPLLVCTQWNGAVNTMYLNGTAGTSVANVRTFGYTNYTIGTNYNDDANSFYSGLVGEILVYNASLSTAQREQVEGYLAWKWGLQRSLPTTHPYYYAAPNSQNLVYPPALKIPAPIQSFAATSAPIVLFNPKSFGNLAVWLDAADTTTITTSGSNITEWRDKSGNRYTGSSSAGRNFTYATSVQNTLNVAQTATGQTLSLTNVTLGPTLSAFLLCYPLNQSSDTAFLEHGPDTNTNAGFFLHTQNSSQIGIRNTSGYVTTSAYPNYTLSNTWQLPTLVNPDPNASSQASFYLNGSLKFSLTGVTGSNVTQTLFLNGRNNTNTLSYPTYVAELLIYTAALTNSQRQQVEGYLAWKWGIQSTLPSDHLYKNTVPGPIGISIPTRSMGQTNFSPARVSGCLMWLDANDINGTGINPALGTTFTSWTDKSGSGNTVIGAASSTLSNYSGRNAVYMNATSFTKSATFAVGNTTMFLVFAVSAAQNDKPYLTIGSGANSGSGDCTVLFCDANVAKPGGSPLGRIYYGSGGGTQLQISYGTATAADVIPYCIQSFTISSTPVVTNYLNGFANAQKTGSVARVSVSNATVGGSLIWYLSEFIMYNSVLSDSTRQQIEGYLAWKWNLQGSIPRTSPFSKIPPLPN